MIDSIRKLKSEGQFGHVNSLIPYAGFVDLGVKIVEGQTLSVLRKKDSNIGNTNIPAVHGGVVGAALEHAAIIELLHALDLDEMPRVINISIDYLRPVLADDLWLQAFIVRRGRRIANVRCEAWQDDREKLVAQSHANFKLAD